MVQPFISRYPPNTINSSTKSPASTSQQLESLLIEEEKRVAATNNLPNTPRLAKCEAPLEMGPATQEGYHPLPSYLPAWAGSPFQVLISPGTDWFNNIILDATEKIH